MFPIRDHNPSTRTPYVTIALVLANIAVFLLTWPFLSGDAALYRIYTDWAMIPAEITAGQGWITLISSQFLHAGWMHLGGNMLFLWVFGDNLEDELGHFGFLGFYLACGVGAAAAQILADPASGIPTVGASGAIAGVLGGYLLMFPKARIDVLFIFIIFFRIFPIPAWVTLGFWFALQVFNGAYTDVSGGGVAYWAHAGGFVIGLGLMIPFWLRRGGTGYWNRTHGTPPHPEAKYAKSSIPAVRR